MSELILQILKYASVAFAVGVTFVGTWFYEFTTTDKETGRRSLTPWGRRAVVVAVLSLAMAGVSTLWSDQIAAEATRSAKLKLAAEHREKLEETKRTREYQARAEDLQKEMTRSQADAVALLKVVNDSVKNLSPAEKSTLEPIIKKIGTPAQFKEAYPELYKMFMAGKPVEAVMAAADEIVDERLLKTEACKDVNISPNNQASFSLVGGNWYGIGFWTNVHGIQLLVSTASDDGDLNKGFRFIFADGTESPKLTCSDGKSPSSCQEVTENAIAKNVFRMLQDKTISEIRTAMRTLSFKPGDADRFRHYASCVVP